MRRINEIREQATLTNHSLVALVRSGNVQELELRIVAALSQLKDGGAAAMYAPSSLRELSRLLDAIEQSIRSLSQPLGPNETATRVTLAADHGLAYVAALRERLSADFATAPTETSARCPDCGHESLFSDEGTVPCQKPVRRPESKDKSTTETHADDFIACGCKYVFPASTEQAGESVVLVRREDAARAAELVNDSVKAKGKFAAAILMMPPYPAPDCPICGYSIDNQGLCVLDAAHTAPAPVAQPEADPCPLHSPCGQAWHDWFERVGEHATIDVVNATANLVIIEREIHASTTTPSTTAVEAAREIAALLFAHIFHPSGMGGISEEREAEIAAIISRYLPVQQPEADPCPPHSPCGKAWHEWFGRVGQHATIDVVNATATLVIKEREIHESATTVGSATREINHE